jgi:NeuB family
VFSPEDVDFLEQFNPPAYKIASFEITDTNLIKYAVVPRLFRPPFDKPSWRGWPRPSPIGPSPLLANTLFLEKEAPVERQLALTVCEGHASSTATEAWLS